MLLQGLPKIRKEKGKIRTVKIKDRNHKRPGIPKEDAVTLNHQRREELMLVRERTGLLATEVGGRLGYATTSRRVLVPEERNVITYTKRNVPGHLHRKVVTGRA